MNTGPPGRAKDREKGASMYDKRAERQAKEFGILDKMQELEVDLLKIDGVSDIDFDLDCYSTSNRSKYCTDCTVKVKRRQQAEYARRKRASVEK